ncbi:P-type conjugative transfer protein VirB9 [Phyllobacterium myrsinacearum]|uniref:Type IV secretion system protein VirB9 n=1 Tax=Phyllobacterium myrsinacearum TaxID=28101 RepID=A0A839EF57_9HYPH|nr:P-type conjugative transfer protein VirB9 [Phyllobacterium myrsinacearum]MBA8877389.1 type IV secretion system protein VirB9 [Phyllobacterium myrsinacearum]
MRTPAHTRPILPVGAVLTLAVMISGAHAELAPRRGAADARVRTVIYSPNNVVAVDATYGVSTMIVLGDAEKIETVAVGDSVSWKIEPNKKGNIIFLKPVEQKAATNMNIVSDKHVYTFVLRAHPDSQSDQTYMVKFRYPDVEADARLLAQAQQLVSEPNHTNFRRQDANADYHFRGDRELKPVEAFDDGIKTWFRFQGDVPAVFIVEEGKREILANYRREGDYIIVDKIARQWMLRHGDSATCLFNLNRKTAPLAVAAMPPVIVDSPLSKRRRR